jgi:hypothetical protein
VSGDVPLHRPAFTNEPGFKSGRGIHDARLIEAARLLEAMVIGAKGCTISNEIDVAAIRVMRECVCALLGAIPPDLSPTPKRREIKGEDFKTLSRLIFETKGVDQYTANLEFETLLRLANEPKKDSL